MVQNGISQILVMERGTLRERGTYAELTADPDSVFNSLLQQQQTPDDDEFSIARYVFMTAKQKLIFTPFLLLVTTYTAETTTITD